jgi:FixJ family two-component response regulator
VEDDSTVRGMVSNILKSYGYKIYEFSEPVEAIKFSLEFKEHIHLLFTDVIMPQFSGKELYQEVVLTHPEIKVLYTSGYTDDIITTHGIMTEEISFLQKPFTVQNLLQKVRETLEAK